MLEINWLKVENLFGLAIELPSSDRPAFLKSSGAEPDLCREVDELLLEMDIKPFFLEESITGLLIELLKQEKSVDETPDESISLKNFESGSAICITDQLDKVSS